MQKESALIRFHRARRIPQLHVVFLFWGISRRNYTPSKAIVNVLVATGNISTCYQLFLPPALLICKNELKTCEV